MSEVEPRSETDMVLSSVRKLVSTGKTMVEDDGLPEKLLLTPAFRVDEGIEDIPPANSAESDQRRTPTFFRSPRRFSTLEVRIAELERAVGSQDDNFEPDGSEEGDEETPTRFVFQHRGHAETAAEDTTIGSTVVNGAAEPTSGAEPAEVSVVVSPKLELHDEVAMGIAPPEPEETLEADDAATNLEANLDGLIDETALQEIVAQMVRAELQGELGEKITRNVRKLVRREIHRVLLTHDFG